MEIAVLGISNAGKSTLVNLISRGEFSEDMVPTIGFNMRKFKKGSVSIKMWDLGGQDQYRQMWERYCLGMQAIVFVVDSTDASKFDTAREELRALMAKPRLGHIPLLVLCNKNDLSNARPKEEILAHLDLVGIKGREVATYSISCKDSVNIDVTLQWLVAHASS